MRQLLFLCAVSAALCILPATASADWIDQFDQYVAGSGLHGQGGWAGWDNDPQWDAIVTNTTSRSPDNALQIVNAADLVHPYTGYTSGKWTYTAWMYIPNIYVPGTLFQHFLLQNTYNHGGPYSWSVQIWFADDGLVHGNFGAWNDTPGPAYKIDEWVKITVDIDLDNDWCQVYYDGILLDDPLVNDHPILGGGYSWTGEVGGGGAGALNIGSVDLFANGNATPVFYDDISLLKATRWVDDIETYAVGSDLHGQGGWLGWDNTAAAGALVSNAQAHSGSNSIDISAGSDLVYEYEGYTSGVITYTAWQYIPTGFTGQSYFIMLDQYDITPGVKNWVIQFYFNDATGLIGGNFGGAAIDLIPYVLDQWCEVKVVANFNEDWCQIYYNGTLLDDPAVADHPTLGGGYQWSLGYGGGGTVTNNIGALDLFANGATTIYYDDISIDPMVPCLGGDKDFISEAVATQCNFVINAGFENANRNYMIFAGVTGVEPGTPLPGGMTLPLNWDAFTNIAINLANGAAMVDFVGVTDYMGNATAVFDTLAPQTGLAGLNLYFAATMNNPFDWASNGYTVRFLF
jgi:hypothetical protein